MSARLDAALAARGLARSRTQAAQWIEAGLVSVDGVSVVKPSARVAEDARLEVAASDHYVSRAAHKLLAALDAFAIVVTGRDAVDLGASTGGFTQVLRERGAARVVAIDVGHDQMAAEVAADAGVINLEGVNARYLTSADLAARIGGPLTPGIICGDLSFISLAHVLPAVSDLAGAQTDVVLLVKPQFEVGRDGVREGLVTDPDARADAVSDVLWKAWDLGLGSYGVIASPVVGTHGNREYLVWLRATGADDAGNPTQWWDTIVRVTGER